LGGAVVARSRCIEPSHGFCLAGGSELATGCDVVYMAEDGNDQQVGELMAEAGADLFGHRFRVDVEVYRHGDSTTPRGKEHLLQMLTDPTPF